MAAPARPIASPPVVSVEVYSDVVCPWCYIGKRRFERAVAGISNDVTVQVRYRAFQLDPAAPLGITEPAHDAYARKFGGPDRAAAIVSRLSGLAAAEGLVFDMARAQRSNTRDAHRLLWWAAETAGLDHQALLKEQLLAAYFTDGTDIGDHQVLAERARQAGLDGPDALRFLASPGGAAEVAQEMARAVSLEVTGVPAYVLPSGFTIPGAQDTDVFASVLRRLGERAAVAATPTA